MAEQGRVWPPRSSWRSTAAGLGAASLFGTLAAAGQPGLELPVLGLVGLFGCCWLASGQTRLRDAAAIAGSWGATLMLAVFAGTASWGWTVTAAGVGLGVLVYALPLGVWSWWAARRLGGGWMSGAATVCVWTAWHELLDSAGLPYKFEALTLVTAPVLVAGARLLGASAVGAIVLAAILVAAVRLHPVGTQAIPRSRRLAALGLPLLTGLTLLLSLAGLAHVLAPPAAAPLRVGVPQINVGRDYYEGRLVNARAESLFRQRFDELLTALDDVELVVLTETYDGRFALLSPTGRAHWRDWAHRRGQAALVTSFLVDGEARRLNVVAAVDANGHWRGVHEKVELAPFGEAPLGAGRHHGPLPIDGELRIGTLICNESLLSWPARLQVEAGANLLAATVSDVTFGSSVVVFAHLALTQLRAIETGRDIIWASNAGPSGRIDRWGRLAPRAPFRYPAAIAFTVERSTDVTPYLHLAPLLPWLCVGTLLLLGWTAQRRLRGVRPTTAQLSLSWPAWLAPAGLVIGFTFAAGSFALVELRQGDPRRTWLALDESWRAQPLLGDPDPYARYRDPGHPDRGALNYFLAYYGLASPATPPAPGASLEELAAFLRDQAGLPVAVHAFTAATLPRVAALARLANGEWVVVNQPRTDVDAGIVMIEHGEAKRLAPAELERAGLVEGLVPTPVTAQDWRVDRGS